MPPYVVHDTGSFTMVPLWIIEQAGDRALRLYCLMGAKYGSFTGQEYENIYPSHKRLSEDIGCSVNSIKRALKELEGIGALKTEHRYRDNGSKTSNQYTLISVKSNKGQKIEYSPQFRVR